MIRIERRERWQPSISIAPLVDCVFLLLIFFLLTSTFSRHRHLKIELPGSRSEAEAPPEAFEVVLLPDGRVRLADAEFPVDALAHALRRRIEKQGRRPVLLIGDRRSTLEHLTAVIDSVREAGLDTVAIATRPKPGAGESPGVENR